MRKSDLDEAIQLAYGVVRLREGQANRGSLASRDPKGGRDVDLQDIVIIS